MTKTALSPEVMIAEMGAKAREASTKLARLSSASKAAALVAVAAAVRADAAHILEANVLDLESGKANGLTSAMLDRLALTEERVEGIAKSVEAIAGLRDPVGMLIDESVRPNGLKLSRVRVPLGVVGIIYESRPNVTIDAAALCIKSGNAVILRGGSEAINSNRALHKAMAKGLAAEGVSEDAAQLIPVTDRALVGAMLTAHGVIDIIIPRGGKALVERVQNDARVPVLAHLDGLCHTYIDQSADPEKALAIAVNAKMRRTGICGAMETLLIDRAYADPRPILSAIVEKGCELRGDADVQAIEPRTVSASAEDWDTEYLDSILSVALVDGVDGAMDHIARHSSDHTDAIIAEDQVIADKFLAGVDSAIVMHNASTQFADGGEFGLGAEIGIATGRLHARGPVALEGLTTYKWLVRGSGQIRP
jgi:glutamate-5-semialdehyde dehydrogenase